MNLTFVSCPSEGESWKYFHLLTFFPRCFSYEMGSSSLELGVKLTYSTPMTPLGTRTEEQSALADSAYLLPPKRDER